MRCIWCLRWYAGTSVLRCSHLNAALAKSDIRTICSMLSLC
ncbi:unknow [Vibrio parahaemolyticus]|nr:unknow [Vibrio parahaemolyticus]